MIGFGLACASDQLWLLSLCLKLDRKWIDLHTDMFKASHNAPYQEQRRHVSLHPLSACAIHTQES